MKTSALVQAWQDFLRRRHSEFQFIEIQDVTGEVLRGEISKMEIVRETLTIRTNWTAKQPKGAPIGKWQGFPDNILYFILNEYSSEPQEQGDGSVYFRSSFQDNHLYPAEHDAVRGFKKP